jgi:hypothetical protein
MKIAKVLFFFLAAGIVLSCNAQSSRDDVKTQVKQAEKVQVYYFHMSRRCATCKAVEDVSRQAVQEMSSEKVSFEAYNLEKPEGENKANELNVSGQTLLIAGGDKKINITREGFMHARTRPEKLKEILQEKVKSLL